MIDLVLLGAAGRMGRAVEEAVRAAPDLHLKACVDRAENLAGRAGVWGESLEPHVSRGCVVVEFSSPEACRQAVGLCAERGAALVSGTTGLSAEDEAAVRDSSRRCAILRASNFSLGISALRRALRATLEAAPSGWDIEIVERHHRRKLDSPSGTALTLARDAAAARGIGDEGLKFGRQGRGGPRPEKEIGVHAVRGGTWVGDHAILFAGEGEWIELRHVATDRSAFAQGALAAARFVAGAPAGLYSLEDCLPSRGRED
jgi:4-hydroxy-tetrahydrodipicolinate reductase